MALSAPADANPRRQEVGDSVYMLPLSIIPLESPALSRALMIKNARLESVLELFEGEDTGSGQIYVSDVRKSFPDTSVTDIGILHKLSQIPSYDVYSLRVMLRKQGIDVADLAHLKLSPAKQNELNKFMQVFTRRLIQEIYGVNSAIRDFDDVIALFRDPDIQTAMENLRKMAGKLEISLDQIPHFMQDYGDDYMSICYYRHCHELISPQLINFLESVDEILDSAQLQQDRMIVNSCTKTRAAISKMSSLVHSRLHNFDKRAEQVWDNITARRFREFKEQVESQHTTIGEMLCVLTVKLNAWSQNFPSNAAGGLYKRVDFIATEMQAAL